MGEPNQQAGPVLQPPGAGLPWPELMIARHVVFPLMCRRWTWAAAGDRFRAEGAGVLAVWDALPPNKLTQRVLVRRLTGMEDSSRHWSVAMTVEHLVMVGTAIRGVIAELRRGVVPGVEARTADFKPKGESAPAAVRAAFEALLAGDSGPAVPPGVGPRFPHPWFGPIDAHRWQCLLAFHQGIHRKQAEAIRRGLGADSHARGVG